MSKQSKWKKRFAYLRSLLIPMIGGGLIGLLSVFYFDGWLKTMPELLVGYVLLLVSLALAVIFHIIIHETGHLVFGLLTGYRFVSFQIGSLKWYLQQGKLKFKRQKITAFAGQCLMSLEDPGEGKIPFVLYNLGGALFNLISGLIFGLIAFLLPGRNMVIFGLWCFCFIGLITAAMNAIPIRSKLVDNDGYNLRSIAQSEAAQRAFRQMLQINEELHQGKRIKDLPMEYFVFPTDEDMQNSIAASAASSYLSRLMDEHRFDEAQSYRLKWLEEDNALCGIYRRFFTCDRIYCELLKAQTEESTEAVRSLLDEEQLSLMKQMKQFPEIIRTEYTVALLLDADSKKAETLLRDFERLANGYPAQGDIETERELMQIAKSKFEARTQGS